MSLLLIVVLVAIAAILILVVLPLVYVKNYIKVPPNEVAVFTGRGTPKVVRGGARFRMPGIERVDIMSLEPFNVSINLQNALSNNGVPVNVEAVGLVRIVGLQTRYFLPVWLLLVLAAAAVLRRVLAPRLTAAKGEALAVTLCGWYAFAGAVLLFQHYFVGPVYTIYK